MNCPKCKTELEDRGVVQCRTGDSIRYKCSNQECNATFFVDVPTEVQPLLPFTNENTYPIDPVMPHARGPLAENWEAGRVPTQVGWRILHLVRQ